jgi:hypothetical protein
MSAEHRQRRARAAALSRHDPEAAAEVRRQLKVDAATKYVQRLVDDWPPLDREQRARLAAMLLAGDGDPQEPATDPGGAR